MLPAINSRLTVQKTFRIHYALREGISELIDPLASIIGSPYPNPFSDKTRIYFTLPDKKDNFNIDLQIYNSSGQLVKVLMRANVNNGFHSIEWDGNDDSGNPVNDGIYLLRMIIDGESSSDLTKRLLKR